MRRKVDVIKKLARTAGLLSLLGYSQALTEPEPLSISGIYPHLTMANNEGECGTGAVVPWQNSLYVITYGPHCPGGSSDKLYEVTPDLQQRIFPGSVGGTSANRMIHKESNQLLIGPYLIDAQKQIRVIPSSRMYGRLTGNARHLTDPARKVYYATMEEGLYEVDMETLDIKCLIRDGNKKGAPKTGVVSELPGYHGKGLYSGQGRVIYANNGDTDVKVKTDPTTPSGALAQWFGEGDWQLVRRNQFTEVTGPGGINGNENPATDPIWAMGWDARSLLLALFEDGGWTYYRLPKGSHSYDGAHGWNTEWPRIREIGENGLLATMHGTFWKFPATFSKENSAGIVPRSNYLKVIGDFAKWNNKLVFGCDDSAKSEFLNRRTFKSKEGGPKESNSNLWFIDPEQLDHLGPVIGRGSVWLRDNVDAGVPSDPYLFSDYDYRQLNLSHTSGQPVTFSLEVDPFGSGQWTAFKTITVQAKSAANVLFAPSETGAWIRLIADQAAAGVTAHFHYRNKDTRGTENSKLFDGVATLRKPPATRGLMRSLSHQTLGLGALDANGQLIGTYELNQRMELLPTQNPEEIKQMVAEVTQPRNAYQVDAASVLIIEDGKRYRLPKNDRYTCPENSPVETKATGVAGKNLALGAIVSVSSNYQQYIAGSASLEPRVCREVATERDLLSIHGTFYELPARNAGGLAKIRPIATPEFLLHDFCSHNGLIFFTGIDADSTSEHIIRSADGNAAVWAGVVDDLWLLGKPRGEGGPWEKTNVKALVPSDPYLMTGYDRKQVKLSAHDPVEITLEGDVDGTDLWVPIVTLTVEPGKTTEHTFPEGFSAYWVRAVSSADTTASVLFKYE